MRPNHLIPTGIGVGLFYLAFSCYEAVARDPGYALFGTVFFILAVGSIVYGARDVERGDRAW